MIKATEIGFAYPGSPRRVLDGLSLHLERGEYLSLVGENGSGKSTLVRILLGLLKADEGLLWRNIARIGYVPQNKEFVNSQFPLTVAEMLDSYRRILKLRDRGLVASHLEKVGMVDYAGALIGNLSGGQLQRVFIARSLLGSPDLLVLDEPSTGVDTKSQRDIYHIIRSLNRNDGITILSVEHNLDAAVMNSSSIFHIANGRGHRCTPEAYADEFLNRGKEAVGV